MRISKPRLNGLEDPLASGEIARAFSHVAGEIDEGSRIARNHHPLLKQTDVLPGPLSLRTPFTLLFAYDVCVHPYDLPTWLYTPGFRFSSHRSADNLSCANRCSVPCHLFHINVALYYWA